MSDGIKKWENKDLAAENGTLKNYLQAFDLPTDNVIADFDDREAFTINFPRIMSKLSKESRSEARYLSKAAIASSIGLFDAAVNYLWNEVVVNLRGKAIAYGLDAFFDEAVGGDLRESYKNEEDIKSLKDVVLIDTCGKLQIISEILHLELAHILNMRNKFAASHPNEAFINGSKLISWLETCAKDVVEDKTSPKALELSKLIGKIKNYQQDIDGDTLMTSLNSLKEYSTPHINNFLATLFSVYIDPKSTQIQRRNILKYAKMTWDLSTDDARTSTATKLSKFREQLEKEKIENALEFLKQVDGKNYETISDKIIALSSLADRLKRAHEGWDNFYTEPPIAKEIMSYIKNSNDLPDDIAPKLIDIIIRCRVGRGVSYNNGISPMAKEHYDQFIGYLDDKGIILSIQAIINPTISAMLNSEICQAQLVQILNVFEKNAITERLKEVIAFLKENVKLIPTADKRKEFKNLFDPIRIS